jgi:hypothetical protein
MRDARVLEDSNGRDVERGFGGAATFKRFEKVNIFGDAFKKYVNTRKWDDPKGLSDYKALIASHENGTLAGRSQRAALEKDRASRRDAATAPTESLSAKHAATIRDMQETLRIRREKLNQVLSASTSSGLEEQLSRLSVEAEEHKRRREREKAAKKFLKPLTAAQLEAVQDALRAPSTQILASGSFVGQGALDATGKDIATLKTGTWLNDEVANFAIGLLSQRAINSMPKGETQPKVHFSAPFSSTSCTRIATCTTTRTSEDGRCRRSSSTTCCAAKKSSYRFINPCTGCSLRSIRARSASVTTTLSSARAASR